MSKAIIVEGKTDREQLLKVLDEPVEIICTYGTINPTSLEMLIDEEKYNEIYVLVDADEPGNKLRRSIKNIYPNARHLYTRRMYREVASTPFEEIYDILKNAHFNVKEVP
ncbi:Toprim domain protein [Dehalobacter sp. UNSWDHB]|uniref:toprim domain-containing protein n=1 Tax=Dehalobacter sp. UNSWDHB TaxID=1339256 RepID=UPI00038C71C4|nr:toprim domain-containing protein [Dehalobacter sp. UNSWDHB]EQB20785.1 Toprim domain protein [Dehalobacter sp. UNSWDHB]